MPSAQRGPFVKLWMLVRIQQTNDRVLGLTLEDLGRGC